MPENYEDYSEYTGMSAQNDPEFWAEGLTLEEVEERKEQLKLYGQS